jgi:galactose mutarotase-like enzyme
MVIVLEAGEVRAEIVPERGALVTSLRVAGRELLYLDRATLDDPSKNVRGGIPLLFPFAGKLAGGVLALTGTTMKQHGFARDRAWQVTEQRDTDARMTLAADDATRALYPYDFTAHHRALLLPRGLQLELTLIAGAAALPVSPGWHPYFAIDGDKARVHGDGVAAGRFADDRETDTGIVAPLDGRSRFANPALELEASPELRHLQLWTLPGKPFVCIEPFFGPAGTIDSDARGWVPAGAARTFWMRILSPRP